MSPCVCRQGISFKRLLERGLVEQDAEKHWHITESGRMVIRRQL
jgi:Mn-dependent DtxR family transcriptional regulator